MKKFFIIIFKSICTLFFPIIYLLLIGDYIVTFFIFLIDFLIRLITKKKIMESILGFQLNTIIYISYLILNFTYIGFLIFKKYYKKEKSSYRNVIRIRRLVLNKKLRIGETYRNIYVTPDFLRESTFNNLQKTYRDYLEEIKLEIMSFNDSFFPVKSIKKYLGEK